MLPLVEQHGHRAEAFASPDNEGKNGTKPIRAEVAECQPNRESNKHISAATQQQDPREQNTGDAHRYVADVPLSLDGGSNGGIVWSGQPRRTAPGLVGHPMTPDDSVWWRDNGQEFAAALEQAIRGQPDSEGRADNPPTMILVEVQLSLRGITPISPGTFPR